MNSPSYFFCAEFVFLWFALYLYDDNSDIDADSHAFVVVKDKDGIFSGAYYETDGERYYTPETAALAVPSV